MTTRNTALANAAHIRWQTQNLGLLLHQTWDTDTFVFNPSSGHTHVLNEAAFTLLSRLADHPSTGEDLVQSFGADTQELRDALWQQLQQLELVGLICPAPQLH